MPVDCYVIIEGQETTVGAIPPTYQFVSVPAVGSLVSLSGLPTHVYDVIKVKHQAVLLGGEAGLGVQVTVRVHQQA